MDYLKTVNKKYDIIDSEVILLPCDYCQRSFVVEALGRHQSICYKVHLKNLVKNSRSDVIKSRMGKDVELNKTRELIKRKWKRRKQWRNDHKTFAENFLSMRTRQIISDDNMPSDVNTMDYDFSLYTDADIRGNSKMPLSKEKNQNVTKPASYVSSVDIGDNTDSYQSINEEDYIQQSNNAMKPSPRLYSSPILNELITNLRDSQTKSSLNSKIPNACIEIHKHYKESSIVSKVRGPLKSKQRDRSAMMSCNEYISETPIKKLESNHQDLSTTYMNKVSRVLKYYHDMHWTKENKTDKKVLEEIPQHLSAHKLQLERFKRFNSQRLGQGATADVDCDQCISLPLHRKGSPDEQVYMNKTPYLVSPRKVCASSNKSQSRNDMPGLTNSGEGCDVHSSDLPDIKHRTIHNDLDHHSIEQDTKVKSNTKYKMEPFINVKLDRFKVHHRNQIATEEYKILQTMISQPLEIDFKSSDLHLEQKKEQSSESKYQCSERKDQVETVRKSNSNDETSAVRELARFNQNRPIAELKTNPSNPSNYSIVDEYKRSWRVNF